MIIPVKFQQNLPSDGGGDVIFLALVAILFLHILMEDNPKIIPVIVSSLLVKQLRRRFYLRTRAVRRTARSTFLVLAYKTKL
jgi:hypothetical protein